MTYYYTTQPFLAWALNHYFYNRTHYVWAGTPFHPYRAPNPKSSDPYYIYADLYHPWKDDDPFDRNITGLRSKLREGVLAKKSLLGPPLEQALKDVCDKAEVALFYPIVYRIDTATLDTARLDSKSGSGAKSSQEVRITDLRETEFDILFDKEHGDADIAQLAAGHHPAPAALVLLQKRCK